MSGTDANAAAAPAWVRDAVFYEIFPDRFANGDRALDPDAVAPWGAPPTRENVFGGDLRGITEHLDHIRDLGASAIYLTPIFEAGSNHRYDTWDYSRIDPRLGDERDLRRLVDEAHALGIRIVLDGVFNHVGDGFWAFRDVLANGAHSPYADWFLADSYPLRTDPPNYQTCGGAPYLPKLNHANRAVREHLLEVAVHWLDVADIDGWRLDVPWKVPLDFWREFRRAVRSAKPDAYLVGEAWWSWGSLLEVFDGLMNYRLRDRVLAFCVSDSMDAEDFAIEAEQAFADAGDAAMLNLIGSHDTPRLLTLAAGDKRRAKLALTALLTLPGTPMLYYGDEVGLQGGDDPDCRGTMPWRAAEWRVEILDHVRRLIGLRTKHPSLRRGNWQPLLVQNRSLVYRRASDDDETIVVLNAGNERQLGELPAGRWHDALTGQSWRGAIGERSAALLVSECIDA